MMVDEKTIKACLQGDERTHREIYRLCAPYIYAIVKNYFALEEDRKDAMQDVFASLFTSIKNYDRDKGSFKSWLSRLVVFQCISIIKKTKPLFVSFSSEMEESCQDTTLEKLEKFSQHDIEKMFEMMPTGYKTIFLLNIMEDYSHKEIGELLGITPETSRSQLFRAIKWIRTNVLTDAKMVQYGLL
jgi:RNA polymerase sigma-70 factor (ECF subfamily)